MPQPRLDRRAFLARSLALGCSAAASPFLTPVTLASAPGDARLVVIILRGAMDGLDLLRPIGAPELRRLRPRLGQAGAETALDDFHALHPLLDPLMPMWRAGELGFVQAVSTPYRDKRSHFDGQDLLEAGTGADAPDALRRDGWLNRAVQRIAGATARTAFAVGHGEMRIMDGDAAHTVWSPGLRLDLSAQSQLLLNRMYAPDALFEAAARDALTLAEGRDSLGYGAMLRMATRSGADAVRQQENPAEVASFVAGRLREDTRIAAFSLGGWDTHRDQHQTLRRALGRLETTLLTLRAELGPDWGRTAVLAMTEFGRTVRENGSGGTDHGTGGAMIYAGGALRGGRVLGDWPGLGEADLYEGRDLLPTRDVRALAGWVLHALFGLDRGAIETAVFPGLDMGARPGFLL